RPTSNPTIWSPGLVRLACLLGSPASGSVLAPGDIPCSHGSSYQPPNLISSRSFQTSATSRDTDTAAKCIGAGAGIGTAFGSLIIGYARNPSLKQQLSDAILGFALSEAMGLSCLLVAFLVLSAM
uniref:ATP synthase lipid-binding protein n=1 Tax=Myotis lucifugus TaxID=59463 RepID=G1QF97_MYOLU